jgi:hypothetical protein
MKSHIDDFDLFEFSRGEKSVLQRFRIQSHLFTCAECRSRVESFRMTNRVMKLALVGEFPSRRHIGWFSGWRITLFALTVTFLGGIMGLKTLSSNDLSEGKGGPGGVPTVGTQSIPDIGPISQVVRPRPKCQLRRRSLPSITVAPLGNPGRRARNYLAKFSHNTVE